MLQYIIWDVSPEIIEGSRVRWYGLFFAIGFFVSYTFLGKIFKKEGLSQKELDNYTFTTFILLLLGLRLGHCLFYEAKEYLANPIRILYVWEGGLASHGGAIGLLVSFFVFSKKYDKSFIWIASRSAVVVSFTAACVRMGNLMNSEIYGYVTQVPWGFVFLRDALITAPHEIVQETLLQSGIIKTQLAEQFQQFIDLNNSLFARGIPYQEFESSLIKLGFVAQENASKLPHILVKANILPAHHPTQIYEALTYFIIFVSTISYYFIRAKKGLAISSYSILGFVFISIFGFRFFIEFIKNNQVDFEQSMALNMGQWLSVPFIIAGIIFFYIAYKEHKKGVYS